MKNLLFIFVLLAVFWSCEKSEIPNITPPDPPITEIPEDTTGNTNNQNSSMATTLQDVHDVLTAGPWTLSNYKNDNGSWPVAAQDAFVYNFDTKVFSGSEYSSTGTRQDPNALASFDYTVYDRTTYFELLIQFPESNIDIVVDTLDVSKSSVPPVAKDTIVFTRKGFTSGDQVEDYIF